MELTGKVIAMPPVEQGVSKSSGNPWRKQVFAIETIESYPKRVAFTLFGEKIDQNPIGIGMVVKVQFDANSRDYQGRWFTDLSAYRVTPATAAPVVGTQPQQAVPQPMQQSYAPQQSQQPQRVQPQTVAQQPVAAPQQPYIAPQPVAAPQAQQVYAQPQQYVQQPNMQIPNSTDDLPF